MNPPPTVAQYLAKRGVQEPWQLSGTEGCGYLGAVVIPSLAEGDSLFATLESLAANPAELCARFLVVVVINQTEQAPETDALQNQQDLKRLAETNSHWPFPLAWVDACSPGRELPRKRGGVGLARKIGMDHALSCLDWNREPLLISLDADTLVEPSYLPCLCDHFARTNHGAAVLPIRHQPAANETHQLAIERYELFLRSYVLGLAVANSPYAFMTVGSAMACTAEAYLKCGGMNTRSAAEDFYFLDKLAKTCGVRQVNGTTVHPSPRASQRVPFGTGRSITTQLSGDTQVAFYPVMPFLILQQWLKLVSDNPAATADRLLADATKIDPDLGVFLTETGWLDTWPKLQRTHRQATARLTAFHGWFDGLKTLRLIHHLCDQAAPRSTQETVLVDLFALADLPCPTSLKAKLDTLRHHQNGTQCA